MLDLFNWRQGLGDRFQVRVTPKAAANRIKVEHQDDGSVLVRAYVTAAAEDGKANAAVIKLLAKELSLALSSLTITHGLTDRNKTITIRR